MKKKNIKKFLIPVSVLISGIPLASNAAVQNNTVSNETTNIVTSKKQAKSLTMTPTLNTQVAGIFTQHSSHASHGSHGSHGSHRSGY